MKVTLEKLAGSKLSLGIEISPETSKNAYEKMVREAAKTVNVPGFRRGKAPRQMLIQRLGARRLKEFALQEVLQDSIQEAIEQEEIEPLGNYDLDPTFEDLVDRYKPGEALEFAASFDVSPEIPLEADAYKAISVQAEKIEATEQQVDERLEQFRVARATLVPVEGRPAQLGDTTIIDYQGYFVPEEEGGDRLAIEGASSQDFELELAEGKFLPEIIAGLVGMEVETEKEVNLTFPVDYPKEDLAGKAAVFSLALKEVKEKELPELDDEFAADISEEHDTLEKLKAFLQGQFEEQAETQTKSNIQGALTTALVACVEFDVPGSMVEREAQALVNQTAMQMSQYGVDVRKMLTEELVAKMREEARPEAISRVKESLVLQELAKREGLEPDEEAIAKRVAEVRAELAERDYDLDRLREVVSEDLAREAALEWLEANTTVELVPAGTLSQEEEAEAAEAASEEDSEAAETSATDAASPGADAGDSEDSESQATTAAEPS